ncbi:MAG: MFS transporter [Acidimicrobiales bacterium]|nr:MFS transporter [Acidimicrobiales bacterium]
MGTRVISITATCTDEELEQRRRPRTDIVAERAEADGSYEMDEGPFRAYRRELDATRDGDVWSVEETTTYRLAIPVWGWLFRFPVARALRRRQETFGYWWAPPDRLDARAAMVLGLLAAVQIVDGYLGTVLTQTLTFATDEFGHGNEAQGWVLGVVRVGVLFSLVAVALADRRGRRTMLVIVGVGSCIFTVLGGLSPGIWTLGATQLVARGLSTGLGVLIAIVAVEEMPARSRAWAASVLVLSAGLGSGMAVWVLPIADVDIRGWRVIYLLGGLGTLVVLWVGRRLPETQRFTDAAQHEPAVALPDERQRRWNRLVLLGVSAFLLSMFFAPASSFQNDFLKDERGFSATGISIFTIVTSTPAGLGVLVGGYLAETRGRRPVGAAGLLMGAFFATAAFFVTGPLLWLATLGGVTLGGIAIPALAVYGPELFGTHDRGRANGLIVTVGVLGSAAGLVFVGQLSDRWGEIGPPLAILAAGPIIVAWLVLRFYPETAGLELEEINPEDR